METNTNDGSGWSGFFVLKGTFDISALYRPLLEQPGALSMVYGDTHTGVVDFREAAPEDDRTEVFAHVVQKMPIKPFTVFVCGDCPETIRVPSRNTNVVLWSQGHTNPGFSAMIADLVQLNREPQQKDTNYANLLRERVFDRQIGKYAICIGAFSRHPRIMLATRNMELYTWIVYFNGVYLFLWSTDSNYMERVKKTLATQTQNELFYLPVALDTKSLLIIHPMYWVTKFDRVMKTMKQGDARMNIVSYFRNFLLRKNLTQPTALDELLGGTDADA